MRDGRFGRQSGCNQSCRRWSLRYAIGAGAAGKLGATSNDDAELRRDDIQPLGHVRAVGLVLGVDGGNGRFQVFECKIELLGIRLLGFTTKGCLFESGDQLLQPLDPIILADFTKLRRDQHRLQGSNIVWKIDRIQHAESLSNLASSRRRNLRTESS